METANTGITRARICKPTQSKRGGRIEEGSSAHLAGPRPSHRELISLGTNGSRTVWSMLIEPPPNGQSLFRSLCTVESYKVGGERHLPSRRPKIPFFSGSGFGIPKQRQITVSTFSCATLEPSTTISSPAMTAGTAGRSGSNYSSFWYSSMGLDREAGPEETSLYRRTAEPMNSHPS
jgi:hypothetical protein